ncbi:DNA methylase N-4/N-6 domain-containing protein [Burkholderia lata]|uniref:DNA-methyltransferase n=1 Tax=Burkholderia lata (strain ATCC 17760 / DSM 23089 / LMG 22485 / NCIMB 9086 / R18194 / 383) TaxID=482957 RepID=UPI0014545409|nr:site-specific DNA-methyltransferase [Burkholderia lata]VWC55009.1 DNA methylase N-4/N-6 domain-containing protein [Burkholderia lata]
MQHSLPADLINRVHQADALSVMRALPDACVDLVFTDPPYSSGGTTSASRSQAPSSKYIGGDVKTVYPEFQHDTKDQRSWTFWCMTWLAEAYRVCSGEAHLACFVDWRQLPSLTDAIQAAGFTWRGVAVWDKTSGRTRPRMGGFAQQTEFLVWATKGAVRRTDVYLPGVFSERLAHPKRHMTEKPSQLARDVVRLVPAGGVVLDPFAGSGTFLAAAKEAGLNWIGCELEPSYHQVATTRLAELDALHTAA